VNCKAKKNDIYSLLNDDNYKENGNYCSVREYFLIMSGKKLEYSNEVYGPIKLKHKRNHYHYTRQNEILKEALYALKKENVDFSQFDSNGDGAVDAINIMYAGPTQYVDRSWLWPHNFYQKIQLGKIQTYFYQICSLDSLSIGTFCHENGHMLCRFPDLYDYGNRDNDFVRSSGLGKYCLMSAGNHLNNGLTPSPVCAYLRNLAGWCEEIPLNSAGDFIVKHGDYTKVHKFYLSDAINEYFLIENRANSELDASLPSSGLAVLHCDILGSNEYQQGKPSKHYQCALLQADGNKDLENGNNMGNENDLFKETKGTVLSYETEPSSARWDRSDSGLIIKDISKPDSEIKFKVG